MRAIKVVFLSAVLSAAAATFSGSTHAQYYGGLPLYAVQGTLPADAQNLLFRSRIFSAADTFENGGTELKIGYRFSSSLVTHFALVGQYTDASRWSGQRISFDAPRLAKKTTSYGLDLVGTLPILDRLSLSGNAGIARVRADSVFGGAIPIELLNSSDARYTSAARIGLGMNYDFSRSLGLRFGVERYRNLNSNVYSGSNVDADTFSIGMRIRF
jgi:opacity protein-like surface antigen